MDANTSVADEQNAAISLIPGDWSLPLVFRKRLGDQVGRQRTMAADGHLLIVLHAPPTADDDGRQGLLFWRDPAGQWRSTANISGDGRKAMNDHLTQYARQIEALGERESVASTANDYFSVLSELTPLYRAARNQHIALQQARDAVPDARDVINLRDRAYEIERMAELTHSDTRHALDFTIARRAEEQAQAGYAMSVAAHRLNVLVAFFFPIATISAVFGTNLQSGLETEYAPAPFIGSIVAGLLIGVILKAMLTREPRRS